MLYVLKLNLRSIQEFIAIDYFLKAIKATKQKISKNFFQNVEAHIGINWLDYYNEFAKMYVDMGFKLNRLFTTLNWSLTMTRLDWISKKPVVEF